MKIAALGGSLRPRSHTYQILSLALEKIAAQNIATELIDLRLLHLPFCQGERDYSAYPDVEKLRRAIHDANGLIIATPEYHGSLSGVLKNALDLVEEAHIAGKVIGLIGVLGGVHSTSALNTLRVICRHLRCWVLPDQLVIPTAEENFDAEGRLKDQMFEDRLDHLVGHFIGAVSKLSRGDDISLL